MTGSQESTPRPSAPHPVTPYHATQCHMFPQHRLIIRSHPWEHPLHKATLILPTLLYPILFPTILRHAVSINHTISSHTSPHPAAPHRAIPYVTIHTTPFCPRLAQDVMLPCPATPGYLIPCRLTPGHPVHVILHTIHIGPVSCNTTLCHIIILSSREGLSM